MVSYFYFDFNDVEKQSSGKAIRSLLFQLALQTPDTFQKLEILYQKCNNGQQQPAEDVFPSMLREAVAFPGQKFIILDALDECTDRESLLFFIRKLVSTKPQGLHVLATSRKEKDIEDELGSIAVPKIDIQSDIVDTDIRIYIRDRMAADTRLRKWPALVQSEITTALMDKADGMYEWPMQFPVRVLMFNQVSLGLLPARDYSSMCKVKCPQKGTVVLTEDSG